MRVSLTLSCLRSTRRAAVLSPCRKQQDAVEEAPGPGGNVTRNEHTADPPGGRCEVTVHGLPTPRKSESSREDNSMIKRV